MEKFCYSFRFLEGVRFEQHEEFQISLNIWVQLPEPVAKSFFVKFTIMNSLNYPT